MLVFALLGMFAVGAATLTFVRSCSPAMGRSPTAAGARGIGPRPPDRGSALPGARRSAPDDCAVEQRRILVASGLLLLLVAAVLALATGAVDRSSGSSGRSRNARRTPTVASSSSPARSPRCTPTRLNRSAVLPGTPLSVSPLPGTMVAEPTAQISMLGVPAGEISAVSVTGSHSGLHRGRLVAYSQGDGASYVLRRPFSAGERVTVRGRLHLASGSRRFAYAFTVADEDPLPYVTAKYATSSSPVGLQRFHSRPDLKAPAVHVSTPASSGAAPGDIFVAVYASGNGPGGPMIFEDDGQLVWSSRWERKSRRRTCSSSSTRASRCSHGGRGTSCRRASVRARRIITSADYRQLAVVHAGNGLHADLHDFQISPGHRAADGLRPGPLRSRRGRRPPGTERSPTVSTRKST